MKDKKIDNNYSYYDLKVVIITNDSNEIINYKAIKNSLNKDIVPDKRYIQWTDISEETDLGKIYDYNVEEMASKALKDFKNNKHNK